MKSLVLLLLVSSAALAQSTDTPKIVTFNPADKDHCKVVVTSGKPLLQTTYNGTTVAITAPQNWGNGEFSVFVMVTQAGPGEAEINPKEVSALYPDPGHTRFQWFDKAHDLDTLASMRAAGVGQPGGASAGGPGGPGDSTSAMPPPNHPEARAEMDPHVGTRTEEESRQLQLRSGAGSASSLPQLDPAHPPVFLRRATVKQGSKVAGYVFIRKPKGSKAEVTPNANLDEVDIPIKGITYRF